MKPYRAVIFNFFIRKLLIYFDFMEKYSNIQSPIKSMYFSISPNLHSKNIFYVLLQRTDLGPKPRSVLLKNIYLYYFLPFELPKLSGF